jgi:transcriptional regulator with XRE-family HTH domain
MGILLDLSRVDRKTGLRTWLVYHGIHLRSLAAQLGVHPGTITKLVTGERVSPRLLSHLAGLGIPRELLPAPTGRRQEADPP